MNSFVITGYPRLRSGWFAAYLSDYDGVRCYHEALYFNQSLDAEDNKGYTHVGNADCGMALIPAAIPKQSRVLIIERSKKEVLASLKSLNGLYMEDVLSVAETGIAAIKETFDYHMSVPYEHIDEQMENIHTFLGIPYDKAKHDHWKGKHIDPFKEDPDA